MSKLWWVSVVALVACGPGDDAANTGGDGNDIGGGGGGGNGGAVDRSTLPDPDEPEAYSKGECPDLKEGKITDFRSGSNRRAFELFLPAKPEGAPLLFMWHGNGQDHSDFARSLGAANIAETMGWIVVAPDSFGGGIGQDWATPPNRTVSDDLFFDDILSCIDDNFGIDRHKVYTTGFSAGALFSSYLAMRHAEHFAAAVTFSGGSDGKASGITVNKYKSPSWPIPVLMTQGGATDVVTVDFKQMTESMSSQLRDDGSTVIVCSHTAGHTPMAGYEGWAWDFLDAHLYGLEPSPYADGDPSGNLPNKCKWK